MSAPFQIEDDAPTRRMVYLAAFLLIFIPFFQAVTAILPLQLSNIQWRFTVAGMLTSILPLPFVAFVLLLVLARTIGSRTVAMVVAVSSALLCISLLASFVLFVFDALQFKAVVTSAQIDQWKSHTLRVSVVVGAFAIAFGMLALTSFRTPRGAVSTARKSAAKPDDGGDLIVGRV